MGAQKQQLSAVCGRVESATTWLAIPGVAGVRLSAPCKVQPQRAHAPLPGGQQLGLVCARVSAGERRAAGGSPQPRVRRRALAGGRAHRFSAARRGCLQDGATPVTAPAGRARGGGGGGGAPESIAASAAAELANDSASSPREIKRARVATPTPGSALASLSPPSSVFCRTEAR